MDRTWRRGTGARRNWGRSGIVWPTCIALLMAISTYAGAEELDPDTRPARNLEDLDPRAFFGEQFQGDHFCVFAVRPINKDYDAVLVSTNEKQAIERTSRARRGLFIVKRGERVPFLTLGEPDWTFGYDFPDRCNFDASAERASLKFSNSYTRTVTGSSEYLFELDPPRLIAAYPSGTQIRGAAQDESGYYILADDRMKKRVLRVSSDTGTLLEVVHTFENTPEEWRPEMRQGVRGPQVGDSRTTYQLLDGKWVLLEDDVQAGWNTIGSGLSQRVRKKMASLGSTLYVPAYKTKDGNKTYWVGDEILAIENEEITLIPFPEPDEETYLARQPTGFMCSVCEIEVNLGAHIACGQKLFFGTRYYDGEGSLGLGGWGVFDFETQELNMHYPPEMANWSTTAILKEDDVLWFATVHISEGNIRSGGLLRLIISNGGFEQYPLPEVVSALFRCGNAVVAVGTHSVFRLVDGRVTRAEFRHDKSGAFIYEFAPLLMPW